MRHGKHKKSTFCGVESLEERLKEVSGGKSAFFPFFFENMTEVRSRVPQNNVIAFALCSSPVAKKALTHATNEALEVILNV